MIEKLVLLN